MHFGMKNYLKSTRNHTAKHAQDHQSPLFSPQSFWPSIQIFSCLIVANSWDPRGGNEKIKTKGNNDDRNAWWSRKKNSQQEKSGKCGIYLLKKNTVIENVLFYHHLMFFKINIFFLIKLQNLLPRGHQFKSHKFKGH